MPTFAKAASIVVASTLLVAGSLVPRQASAQTAPATERCSGTLCDLYYGNAGASAGSQGAPPSATQQGTPVTVPSGNIFSGFFSGGAGTPATPPGAPAPNGQPTATPFVRVVGGRPANERCSGTLCDAYYAGAGAAPPQQQPPAGQQASAAPVAEPDVAPNPVRKHVAAPQAKPICRNDRDPWQCYR